MAAAALVVCRSCSRHVRLDESLCPFCVAPIPEGLVPPPRGPRRLYVGKNATALALASALVVTGCGGDVETETAADAAPETRGDTMLALDSDTDTAVTDVADSEVGDDGAAFPIYK